MKRRFGFTLAEVLITLGIIGVVAAMTIPTLIANTNSARFRSQFKKSISTLSQAGLMAQAQYDIDYSTYDAATACDPSDDPETEYTFCAIFNGALTGHTLSNTPPNLKDGTTPYGTAASSGSSNGIRMTNSNFLPSTSAGYLTLADGSLVVFNRAAHGCTKLPTESLDVVPIECSGIIDVNGTTLPNKEVSCETGTSGSGSTSAASGSASGTGNTQVSTVPCVVPNDANHMTDIFPIVFHDGTVEPGTGAARYVLSTAK